MKKLWRLWLLAFYCLACIGHEPDFARSLAVKSLADMVLVNGKIVTVDEHFAVKEAIAIKNGRFVAVGTEREVRAWAGPGTRVVDLGGRTVIPGLIDSHIHATAGGSSWDSELHWEFTRSLAEALEQIAAAAKAKPPGSWIVVGGGWVPSQFVERRPPLRAQLDAVAPNHPVYVQYLNQAAVLNSAGLAAAGITRATPDPPDGKFLRDPKTGEPTGVLEGVGAWRHAYKKIPRPTLDKVRQSLRNCFRELNRLGLTSAGDLQTNEVNFAQRRLLADMAGTGELTLRLNYYIAPAETGDELQQLRTAAEAVKHLGKSELFRFAGFGATVIRGAGDMFSNPQGVTIDSKAGKRLHALIRYFAESGYRFQLQATHDRTARQLLEVIEGVNREAPLTRPFVIAHLEDASPETIARIKQLGGGISVQDRLALTGELAVDLWGRQKAQNAPPLRTMLQMGVPLGSGSDAFRSGSYSPMLSLWWLITGKTVAGTSIRDPGQNVSREEALRLYTTGSASVIGDEANRGSIENGKLADLAVLNADYLKVPEDQIRSLHSVLTLVGGRVVYAESPFTALERRDGATSPRR